MHDHLFPDSSRPTQAAVRRLFDYDHRSGRFVWRVDAPPRGKAGAVPGTLRRDGLRTVSIAGRLYHAHHLIWLYTTGEWPPCRLTFKDADRSNLRWRNIVPEAFDRPVTTKAAKRSQHYRLRRAIFDEFLERYGRPPSKDEMSAHVNLHESRLRAAEKLKL